MSAHAVSSRSPTGQLKPKCKVCGKKSSFQEQPLPCLGKTCKICKKKKNFAEKSPMKRECKNIHLDEKSSLLTTFRTPFGRYRWERLLFETSVSSVLFQNNLNAVLEDLEGVIGVSDDVIIYGSGENVESATEDHDKNLIDAQQMQICGNETE